MTTDTRMLTWFSPCIWGPSDGYTGMRSFYHGTAIGRGITNAFWGVLGGDVITLNKYSAHPETAKLKPWSHAMFTASSFSILNYETDFFELVRSGVVKVHIADLVSLGPDGTVNLSDGTAIKTDILCAATGWKHVPPLKFLPEGLDAEIGLPHREEGEVAKATAAAEETADAELFARLPRLRDQPVANAKFAPLLSGPGLSSNDPSNPYAPLTPYRLWHFIAPASAPLLRARDLAFAGFVMNFSVPIQAHVQALWINAYLTGTLPGAPDAWSDEAVAAARQETVLHSRYLKWRYPGGHGASQPDFVFDALPYFDMLLKDMGLNIYKKGGWLAEATTPYGPEDYRGLMEEWLALRETEVKKQQQEQQQNGSAPVAA